MDALNEHDETSRLETLRRYRILDTSADDTLDDLTQLAATICETPIALISLIDEDRQWFKSRVGLDTPQTPRSWSFCTHALDSDDLLIVSDPEADPRVAHSPLVTGAPDIRFYVGAPLRVANGARIGTLCVIDAVHRELDETQKSALRTLRSAVVAQLELRRVLADLRDLEHVIPMCAWCRSVRTDDGNWVDLHHYVATAATVSHSLCPSCTAAAPD